MPSLKRYQSAFALLWTILENSGVNPPDASIDEVANAIVQLFQFSVSQARNACSAMLIIPSFGGLRFHPLLAPYKKLWNKNTEKYGAFWDPLPILLRLAQSNSLTSPLNVEVLRDRLIFCCRVLCLHRSVDLARIQRTTCISRVTGPLHQNKT